MLLPVRTVGKSSLAPFEFALERLLTGVGPLVYLEVLGPCEYLAAAWEGTRKGLFPRVDSDVVDQLVLGLEGPP